MAKFDIASKIEKLREHEMNAGRLNAAASVVDNAGGNSTPVRNQGHEYYAKAQRLESQIVAEFNRMAAEIERLGKSAPR